MPTISQKPKQSYKCLGFLTILYFIIVFCGDLFTRKAINTPFGILPLAIFFAGFYFILSDIITEVYGFNVSKNILVSLLIVYAFFCLLLQYVADLKSPPYDVIWAPIQDPNAYQYIFGGMIRSYFGFFFAYLLGTSINIYLISKWKVLVRGRYFWLRSIGASGISALLFTIISDTIVALGAFIAHHEVHLLIDIMLASFLIKIITFIICAYPATIICIILKKVEGVDVYDYGVNYNPFKKENGASIIDK